MWPLITESSPTVTSRPIQARAATTTRSPIKVPASIPT